MAERLTGLVVATYAPFHSDGSLNLGAVEKHVTAFVALGASGVFVNGTTGEGASLRIDERQAIARRWCEVARAQMPVVVHVGSTCLADCRALAAHAQEIGAAAIACVGPGFFKPATTADLVAFCREVAAAAPGLPLYYRLIAAFERGDLETARQEQHRATELIVCLARHDFLPASKALMKMIGLDCGPVRLPLRPLSAEATLKLHDELATIRFFDWRE